jgi:dTMP kinase
LANDIWVISDRFIDSTYAFQVAVSDIDLRQLFQSTSEIVVGATLPNLTIVLDLPLDVAIGRRSLRSDGILDPAEATRDFASIREGLLTVARKETKRCHVVNANQTLEAVAQDIWFIVERLL